MKKDGSRDWHYRWWCDCGYNYADETVFRNPDNQPMCPECGRPGNRLISSKGRWSRDWESGNPWGRDDWEVWVDPDLSKKNKSQWFFHSLIQRFVKIDLKESTGPVRKDVMSSPVFVEEEKEEEDGIS